MGIREVEGKGSGVEKEVGKNYYYLRDVGCDVFF